MTSFGIWTGPQTSIFQETRKDLGELSFTCERGVFAEAGTPSTSSGKRLHTLEGVWQIQLGTPSTSSGSLTWRMAHRRTGGREGKFSKVTNNFASLNLVTPESLLSMEKLYLELHPKNIFACTQSTSGESNRTATNSKAASSPYVRVAAEAHSCLSVENVFRRIRS